MSASVLPLPSLRLSELNALPVGEFARKLGGIYESSAWIPEAAAKQRPFNSMQDLAKAMASVVDNAGPEKQLALIRAHPRLALKDPAATAALTDNSRLEQDRTGMSSLSAAAQAQFARYSDAYEMRHGFPFVVAVLALDRDAIVRQAGERVHNSTVEEQRRAIHEIHRIAQMRLQRTVVDDAPHATPSTVGSISPATQPLGASRSSLGTRISDCQYGKSRVRVLKVLRDTPVHSVIEVDVQVLLRGSLDSTFTRGDNSLVVPTDTCKNTILVLARESLTDSLEDFAQKVGAHFLAQYAHITSVDLRMDEKVWERMSLATEAEPGVFNGPAAPHRHTFQQRGPERFTCHAVATRAGVWLESGIKEFTLMKSTASGFTHFPKDDGLTVLPETEDRVLATKIAAVWQWASTPAGGFRRANARLMEWMLVRFASRYSVSVQATEYEMALDALAAVPELSSIRITLPNVHFLPFPMPNFKLPFEGRVFIPTDEPHGTIEVEVTRDNVKRGSYTEAEERALGHMKGTKPCAPLPPRPRL